MLKTHPSGKVALNKQGESSEVKLNMEKLRRGFGAEESFGEKKKEAEAGKYTTTDSELFV